MTAIGEDRRFNYLGFEIDEEAGRLICSYALDDHRFNETITFGPGLLWSGSAVRAAARLFFLLAGVSYFKTTPAPVLDLSTTGTTPEERDLLSMFFIDGLGEFAYRNGLDLRDLRVDGPNTVDASDTDVGGVGNRPLIPFGGGIDSIVTVDAVTSRSPESALFVVSRPGDRFAAIEETAAVTGLPVIRAEREIDPQLLRSATLGFLNGHVPVTGIISAIAVLAAVLYGRDSVVMSNERSASVPNLVNHGRPVNHQWSKGLEFEVGFRAALAASPLAAIDYYSYLRPCSELWVAQRFVALKRFHAVFRSCNRAFIIDPDRRLATWCGGCDKCAFIDLVLSPFLDAGALAAIFGGREPLANPALAAQFRTLCGLEDTKPFECVGDEEECRTAVLLASARPDRERTRLLRDLEHEIRGAGSSDGETLDTDEMLRPSGPNFIP